MITPTQLHHAMGHDLASRFRADTPLTDEAREMGHMSWLWLPKVRQQSAERAARSAAACGHFRRLLSEPDDASA